MTQLNIVLETGPHTNEEALNDWMQGLPGLVRATTVREYTLELREGTDIDEIRQRLKTCQFANVVADAVVGDTELVMTNSGLAALAGYTPSDNDTEPLNKESETVVTTEQTEPELYVPVVTEMGGDETLKAWADVINGRDYLGELTPEMEASLKEQGIVVVFGASDDLTEFRGALRDETGSYDGCTLAWTGDVFVNEDDDEHAIEDDNTRLVVDWSPEGRDRSWAFETNAPRWAKFEIMEDGECYGEGLVLYLQDLTPYIEPVPEVNENNPVVEEGAVEIATEENTSSDSENDGSDGTQDQNQDDAGSPQPSDDDATDIIS